MKHVLLHTSVALFAALVSVEAFAQGDDFGGSLPSGEFEAATPDRDPAALVIPPRKRNYPGGALEEDLLVQPTLAESEQKVDARTLQRDVFKAMFNQDLKEERHDDAEE